MSSQKKLYKDWHSMARDAEHIALLRKHLPKDPLLLLPIELDKPYASSEPPLQVERHKQRRRHGSVDFPPQVSRSTKIVGEAVGDLDIEN